MRIETDDALAQAGDHLPVLVAMLEGVEMVRAELLPGSEDDFSNLELLKMIRLAYDNADPVGMDLGGRIDADEAAIKRALATSGTLDFAYRLAAKAGG
ncbi:hypothetical protein [Luteimonas sp. MC1828]|uniref:hypothetical protein n=1 Tax=Luteimonas sp. MC1828 TaxID=2799787 RepID=UPI0018F1DDFC|nr:hypothetical protein [Luteimonas sp. MC1828]MBJ7575673.1 hypothetical protein [Luteimonas sp. MC1828]